MQDFAAHTSCISEGNVTVTHPRKYLISYLLQSQKRSLIENDLKEKLIKVS